MRSYGIFGAALALALPSLVLADPLRYNVSLNSQVRSAYAGPNAITISWNTYYQIENPTVHYGLFPEFLVHQASSDVSVTYQSSLTYNNHVRISGLQPDTKYWYLPEHLIDNPDLVGPFTFKTSRSAGDMTPYSIAVVVDMGAMGSEGLTTTAGPTVPAADILLPGEQNTIQSLTSQLHTFDFLMQPGDLAYADTWLTEVNGGFLNATKDPEGGLQAYESILDDFYDQLTNVSAKVPFMVGPGNHENNCIDNVYACPAGQTNFTGINTHFRMPSDVANQASNNFGVQNMWYSFDNGMVHYIMLDMETDFPDHPDPTLNGGPFGYSGEQVAWLTADLKAVNRALTPWIIVAGHRQWYSSGNGPCTACQNAFEGLFNQYQIDLYISGHYHVFERNVPIGAGGVIDPNGLNDPAAPWYIINGAGGHYGGLNPFNFFSKYQAYGISILNATYGWSRLTFHNRTHMTHELVNSSSNAVLDRATLYKNHTFVTLLPSSSSSTVSSTIVSLATSLSTSSSSAVCTITYSNSTTSSLSGSATLASSSVASSSTLSSTYNKASISNSGSATATSISTTPGSSDSAPETIISTAYTTKVYTISSCAPTVTNCPYGSVTTEVITTTRTTTYCPATDSPVATGSVTSGSAITIPVQTGIYGNSTTQQLTGSSTLIAGATTGTSKSYPSGTSSILSSTSPSTTHFVPSSASIVTKSTFAGISSAFVLLAAWFVL